MNKGKEIGSGVSTELIIGKDDYIKRTISKKHIANIWDDDHQFRDISKTNNEVAKTILGTTSDILANLAKSELQTAEGLVDT